MTGCGINLRPPEGDGSTSGLPTTPKASTSRFALHPAHATDDDNGLGPKERKEQIMSDRGNDRPACMRTRVGAKGGQPPSDRALRRGIHHTELCERI